jgi:hypothetical protein
MYSNKLAVAIKSNGKIVREFGDSVHLPFGSEYSIFIKNKNTVRASVKIEIDGADVTGGASLVVDPNDEVELERFIKNGNLRAGNRFKFIERTSAIEKHRGTSVDDGLIRIEFQFEKPVQLQFHARRINQDCYMKGSVWDNDVVGSHLGDYGMNKQTFLNSASHGKFYSADAYSCSASTVGITAPGSVSNQEFSVVSDFALDPTKHVIVMRLLGQVQDKYVSKVLSTRTRNQCVSCGYASRSDAKFCSQCGTSLQIID